MIGNVVLTFLIVGIACYVSLLSYRSIYLTASQRLDMISLDDVGHYFTVSGELRDKDDDRRFEFNKLPNQAECQIRYENIGDAVTSHIYTLMVEEFKLERIDIPLDSATDVLPGEDFREMDSESTQISTPNNDKQSFIFASHDFKSSSKKKLILMNGSGAVRAGQWARSIIMNDNIYSGSMLPYINWANENDFDVLVFNTNEGGIFSESPIEHSQTVWEDFLFQVEGKSVYIVAHSYGGCVVKSLSQTIPNFEEIVHKIAFTDSVHMGKINATAPTINWVSSQKEVNTILGEKLGSQIRSAGTSKHPWTSHFAMEHIFSWFLEQEGEADLVETSL